MRSSSEYNAIGVVLSPAGRVYIYIYITNCAKIYDLKKRIRQWSNVTKKINCDNNLRMKGVVCCYTTKGTTKIKNENAGSGESKD
jgi:hypothetical protein